VGFYGDLASGIQLGGKESFLNSPGLRKNLKALHFTEDEIRDPYNHQISFWWQKKASGKLLGLGLALCFQEMATIASDLISTIETSSQ